MENGNVPVENPEDPQQGQEQQPPPQPPPPEPESVETVFLSPFSMPGESGGRWSSSQASGGDIGTMPRSSRWRPCPWSGRGLMQRVAIGPPRCPKAQDKHTISMAGESWVDVDTTECGWNLRGTERQLGPQEAPGTPGDHT